MFTAALGAEGYKSVAHYLVMTKLEGAAEEVTPADAAADPAPAEPVDQVPAAAGEADNGPACETEVSEAPMQTQRTRGGAALRQTALTAVLTQTRHGGVVAKPARDAKGGKAGKGRVAVLVAAVAEGLGSAAAGCKRAAAAEAEPVTRRVTRQAVAA